MRQILRYKQEITTCSLMKALITPSSNILEGELLFNSCRSGLKWLLSFYKRKWQRVMKVGLPCYSCYTIYQSVYESYNKAILIDIDPLSFEYSNGLDLILNDLDILLWINYFGFKYENILQQIRSRYPELIIIEDCSHVDFRDFSSENKNGRYSNFLIFSFNFRKPLVAGGGGLIVVGESIDSELSQDLHSFYSELSKEYLSMVKLRRLFFYNFCYNRILYRVFAKFIVKARFTAIDRPTFTIECLTLNRVIEKILYIQFMKRSSYNEYKVATLEYFDKKENLSEKHCFGNLTYFPVRGQIREFYALYHNVDFYILWSDLSTQYLKFGINISETEYPSTFGFLSDYVFVPMQYYISPRIEKTLISNLIKDEH